MHLDDLNSAVAARTGEPIREIAHRGFVFLTRVSVELEPAFYGLDNEPTEPLDWDEFGHLRIGILSPIRSRSAATN